MNYQEEMDKLLKKNMTENGYKFWIGLKNKIPDVLDRYASSSKRYHSHIGEDGKKYTPSIAEHTLEMLFACVKIWSCLGVKANTIEADILLLGIAMHDIQKYGKNPEKAIHTSKYHDRITADFIHENKNIFQKLLEDEDHVQILEDIVRYHSGPWSPDSDKNFNFMDRHIYCMFVHFLDMLSSRNVIFMKGL